MSTRNWNYQRKSSLKYTVKTASATLTKAELDNGFIVGNHASVTVALTLPAASTLYKGCRSYIANKGAATTTVAVSAGYGGAGSGTDTVTLAQGNMCVVACDGSAWYVVHHTTGA